LVTKLLRDKAFYDQSGGGVTYSGGEPALQADFFLETTKLLKKEFVHVALDTAGNIPWQTLAPLVEAVDLVIYDIKTFDNSLHERFTGAGNALILENARLVAEMKKSMIIRMILVPGVNDNEEEIDRRLTFVRDLGNVVTRLDILKYHRLGVGKYLRLGLEDPMSDTPECSNELPYRLDQ
jgi:pyruvate formate lyase activating enzyme